MRTVSIIGTGRLGCALAMALEAAGYRLENLVHRFTPPVASVIAALSSAPMITTLDQIDQISSDLVLITTQDTEIALASAALKAKFRSGVVLHTSGSLSSEVMKSLRSENVSIGSLHPLVSISEPVTGATHFKGAYFCIEGDLHAADVARGLVSDLGAKPFSIDPEKKALYHAAAVMASGHTVALFDTAAHFLKKAGVDNADSEDVLIPLIRSTVENMSLQGTETALTGTYARVDLPAFERHLASLKTHANDNEIDIYLDLALRSLDIALRRFGTSEAVERLATEVSMAKRERRVLK